MAFDISSASPFSTLHLDRWLPTTDLIRRTDIDVHVRRLGRPNVLSAMGDWAVSPVGGFQILAMRGG
jgi:hypothetical protein